MTTYTIGDYIGGRYEVRSLKKGGMGIIYVCLDHKTQTPRVLKSFQDKYLLDPSTKNRFIHEAKVWIELGKCPNIVHAQSIELADDKPYIVLDYVPPFENIDADLRSWLLHFGQLELIKVLSFAIQFCLGMVHVSGTIPGLVHRDIKPENILIRSRRRATNFQHGQSDKTLVKYDTPLDYSLDEVDYFTQAIGLSDIVKITDFGLAKIYDHNPGFLVKTFPEMEFNHCQAYFTQEGAILGTPLYMSPEQWLGITVDQRSDVYAFGCVLYEMLTGHNVFRARNLNELRWCHLEKEPIYPHTYNPLIPEDLEMVVMRSLQKEESKRYLDFLDMLGDLLDVYSGIIKRSPRLEFTPGVIKALKLRHISKRLRCQVHISLDSDQWRSEWRDIAQGLKELGYLALAQDYDQRVQNYKVEDSFPEKQLTPEDQLTVIRALKTEYEDVELIQAIPSNTGRGRAWANIVVKPKKATDYEKELAKYSQALAINPTDTMSWSKKGASLVALGRIEEALVAYDQVLALDPTNVAAWAEKGHNLVHLERIEEALIAYDRSLALDPTQASIWLFRGAIQAELGRRENALADYDRAISLDSKLASAYTARGTTYYQLGHYREALIDYKRAIEITPQEAGSYWGAGAALAAVGQLKEAIPYLEKATQMGNLQAAQALKDIRQRLKKKSSAT